MRLAGGVSAYGCKLVSLASQGWVCTGRKWTFVLAAGFMLASEAFFYVVDVKDAAATKRMFGGLKGSGPRDLVAASSF